MPEGRKTERQRESERKTEFVGFYFYFFKDTSIDTESKGLDVTGFLC